MLGPRCLVEHPYRGRGPQDTVSGPHGIKHRLKSRPQNPEAASGNISFEITSLASRGRQNISGRGPSKKSGMKDPEGEAEVLGFGL